jgi:phosphoglucan,water dikinase
MIYVGNQTSFAVSPLEPFAYAVANGFNAFEWFPDKKPDAGWDERDLDQERRRAIRETAGLHGMRLSVHARWQANPSHPEAYPLLWKDMELAQDLGAALVNLHLYPETGPAAYVLAITPLVRHAAEAGLQVSIENTPSTSPEDFNELFARMRGLGFLTTRRVGMCLDIGHANLCAATRNRYLDFLDRLDPQVPILHLHLHENWGDADTHLPLFTGPAQRDDAGIRGLVERLTRRGFSGSIILEQWPQPPSLLNQARDRLLDLFAQPASGPSEHIPPAPPSGPGSELSKEERRALSDAGTPSHAPSARDPRPADVRLPLNQGPSSPPNQPEPTGDESKGAADESDAAGEPPARSSSEPGDGGDFTDKLIAADKRARSWREKLAAVRQLLAAPESPPGRQSPLANTQFSSTSRLVDLAIYLRFLGTGQIRCEEDGRHFRPAHHARLALQIRERLAHMTTPATAFIARQIYPWLPSSAQTFQRAEPLTRIRDIAHRNDIPQELKREIKTSLQNKLHRCAGPEDLATSTALLERITAPEAGYAPDFVEQFKVFHRELQEFFNAGSLEDRLNALLPKAGETERALIASFLQKKGGAAATETLAAFSSLTDLRGCLRREMERQPVSEKQDRLLADIGLEDFAFVLASQLVNALETTRETSAEPQGRLSAGGRPLDERGAAQAGLLELLALTLRNLELSGIQTEECAALQSELRSWRKAFDPADREQLLRLKATIERSRRLAEDYSRRILELFSPQVERLGRALGVTEPSIRYFCEAEIRSHLVFQLSKLASTGLRRLRTQLALPAWDVLVSGQACGRLRAANRIDFESAEALASEPILLVLKQASGDEEIPKKVSCIVLEHDLPHLSHLAVRARQAGVVFAVCEEAAEVERLKRLAGKMLTLAASPEKVRWLPLSEDSAAPAFGHPGNLSARAVHVPEVHLAGDPPCIPLDQATPDRGGGKADGARRLAELAKRDQSGFNTPPALVVPFGIMEAALQANPAIEREYRGLVELLESGGATSSSAGSVESKISGGSNRAPWERLRGLIEQIPVPDAIASAAVRQFGRQARLMVRSSSNCEDLAEMAGAGLYESVANVPPDGIASAVRRVWASLWTRRAWLSRRDAGIPQAQAHMAVLLEPTLAPELSFVLHTVNPLDFNPDQVYAEVAVGLGEILVSGAARGTAYRLVCDKHSGAVETLAFASFSHALRPARAEGVAQETLDYSKVALSVEAEARRSLGRRLAAIGHVVEEAFQGPQDIEGALLAGDIYLLQGRPQQGLPQGKRNLH